MHKFVQNLTKIVSDRQVILYMERLEQTRDVFKVFLGGVAVAVAVPGRSSYGATFMVPLKILSSFGPAVPLLHNFGSAYANGIPNFPLWPLSLLTCRSIYDSLKSPTKSIKQSSSAITQTIRIWN